MANDNKENDQLIEGHEYDGIQELDNPLPKWWLYLFYATMVFAAGYYGYYELFGGPSHIEQYKSAMENIKAKQAVAKEEQAQEAAAVAEVSVEDLLKDPKALEVGAGAYQQTCAACHGSKGEGMIGPNLTDKYWIHSKGDGEGVLYAIREGFPDKGMPPWKDVVPAAKHAPLAAFIISLQGTNPANAKAPQGDLVE